MLRKTLYGVSNLDPASYAAAIIILLLVAAAAVMIPARKLLRLNVAKALHYQ